VLAGDYNANPSDLDVYKPERWLDDALFRPETRAAYAQLLKQGWTDALRHLHPGERLYTFWDYFRNAWPRDAGLRIDHFLLNPDLLPLLKAAGVDREVRGWEKTSDHAPVWVELEEGGGKGVEGTNAVKKKVAAKRVVVKQTSPKKSALKKS
jgi:exodeoxyribonuclease-3